MNVAVPSRCRRGFTLLEIMVVVAIMGLIMAMGVPSILSALKKDGMRKAVSDLQDGRHPHGHDQAHDGYHDHDFQKREATPPTG